MNALRPFTGLKIGMPAPIGTTGIDGLTPAQEKMLILGNMGFSGGAEVVKSAVDATTNAAIASSNGANHWAKATLVDRRTKESEESRPGLSVGVARYFGDFSKRTDAPTEDAAMQLAPASKNSGPDMGLIRRLGGAKNDKDAAAIEAFKSKFPYVILDEGEFDEEASTTYNNLLKQGRIKASDSFRGNAVVSVDKYLNPDAGKVKVEGFIPLTGEVSDTSAVYKEWAALTDDQRKLLAIAAILKPEKFSGIKDEDEVVDILERVASGNLPPSLRKIQAQITAGDIEDETDLAAQSLLKTGKLPGTSGHNATGTSGSVGNPLEQTNSPQHIAMEALLRNADTAAGIWAIFHPLGISTSRYSLDARWELNNRLGGKWIGMLSGFFDYDVNSLRNFIREIDPRMQGQINWSSFDSAIGDVADQTRWQILETLKKLVEKYPDRVMASPLAANLLAAYQLNKTRFQDDNSLAVISNGWIHDSWGGKTPAEFHASLYRR